MAEIGVIGSGSWGTALALVLNKNGHHVTIWSYLKEEADEIRKKRENPLWKSFLRSFMPAENSAAGDIKYPAGSTA